MKPYHFAWFLIFLLAACQAATATPVLTPVTAIAATAKPLSAGKNKATPTLTPTPSGPAVHSSSTNPNATNLIVVKDQPIINNSLTMDTVISSQAAFIVLYYDKPRNGSHQLGGIIIFTPVPAGRSNQFIIPLTQNLNPTISLTNLPGNQVDAVLQTNVSNANSIVDFNGAYVLARFTILSLGKSKPSIFATATP
ncbi:MAG TPA: hypothetical protein VLX61_11395 [Anaerolineales bacterium]|nr:hypothetical protein [Anaerolineales bacterium]